MTEIEERCISIASVETRKDLLTTFYQSMIYQKIPPDQALKICDNVITRQLLIEHSKKLLTEYQNQLKKYNE